ncbi:MAG: prenyltransferase, partial [Bradyrhizobium sp.]|nr:prenyltransferase [Bradyrhizobium sp.]
MTNGPSAILSFDEIGAIVRDVLAEGNAGRGQVVWQMIQPLRKAQPRQREAAMALLLIIAERGLEPDASVEILSEIEPSLDQDVELLSTLGGCLECARDIDDLNAPPPADLVFRNAVEKLD